MLGGNYRFGQQSEQAIAQGNDDGREAYIQSYADAVGISYEEAQRRLEIQSEFDRLEEQVREGEATYAGSWPQHQPEFHLIVGFTSADGSELIEKYLEGIVWRDLVDVRQLRYTMEQLSEIQSLVSEEAIKTGLLTGSGSNIPASKVTIYTSNPDEMRRQLEALPQLQAYLTDIEYIYQANGAVPASEHHSVYLPLLTK